MNVKGITNEIGTKLYNRYVKTNPDKFLLESTAVGLGLATLSNAFGVAINKETTPEQKKYLIPWEIADGVANLGLFYTLTYGLIKGAEKLVDSGKITLKDNINTLENQKILRGGIGILASVVGAVVSNNVIAPLIRNKIANTRQEKQVENGEEVMPRVQGPTLNLNNINNMQGFMDSTKGNSINFKA